MCGLFGHVRPGGGVSLGTADAALRALAHRGPDQQGDWSSTECLCRAPAAQHPRPVRARTPAVRERRRRRRRCGQRGDLQLPVASTGACAGTSVPHKGDSEVVLHGYRQWGIRGLLDRLEGMYAFCIHDSRQHRLFLARDRVGIKPLYYSTRGNGISWASELKALEAFLGAEQLEQDRTALYDFLTYLYVPSPKSMYKDVFKLEPAHYIEVDVGTGSLQKRCYWQLAVDGCSDSLDAAAERLRSIIGGAVRAQLCSDVPVGFFLSGGIDSSVVVAEATKAGDTVHTYCIGFDDAKHDETAFAKLVADRFGTQHRSRTLHRAEAKSMFANLRDWFDEPFGDTSAFPTYLVSKFARETCKVVLTGDGGDEIFGGYTWYTQFLRHVDDAALAPRWWLPALSSIRRRFRHSLAGKLANRLELGMLTELELHARLLGGLLKEQKSRYALDLGIAPDYDDYWHFRRFYRPELPVFTRLQYLDFHTYLPDDILTKVDRVSMAVSLEARVPLLATEIVEYVFSLPEEVRLCGGRSKGLLKHAYRSLLPGETIERDKKGFSIPARTYAGEIASGGRSRQEAILDELYAVAPNAA